MSVRSQPLQARDGLDTPLERCRSGDHVVISAVQATTSRVVRLASMGIIPGVELTVQQTRPVVVVECDETVLALEREVAATILVRPGPAPAES